MAAQTAQALAALAGVWLIAAGLFMAARPTQALAALAAMGGEAKIHFGEMAVRGLVGLLLILAAPAGRFPAALTVIGGFLILSALTLSLMPRRWHHAYSRWWAARISPTAVRLIAPWSILGGAALIWVLF